MTAVIRRSVRAGSALSLVLVSALVVMLAPSAALAAGTTDVSIVSYAYQPPGVTIGLGGTVLWTNDASIDHFSTSDGYPDGNGTKGIGLWQSGHIVPGATFSFSFASVGTFPYHCALHPTLMHGTVSVPPKASPSSGQAGTVFTVRIATAEQSFGKYVIDVQLRTPGGSFQDWMTGVKDRTVAFDSSGYTPGVYSFRARLRLIRNQGQQMSQYSPSVS